MYVYAHVCMYVNRKDRNKIHLLVHMYMKMYVYDACV